MKAISLTTGQMALVDDGDYDRVNAFKWRLSKNGYVVMCGHGNTGKYLHHFISGKGMDHQDTNKLNNTRINLRPCTQSQNAKNRPMAKNNTSGFKGVCWSKKHSRWKAAIAPDGRSIHLGLFDCPKEAARLYDAVATLFYGEFARTNQMIGLL